MTYYAITGRIHGDDEDVLYVYGPCSKEEALGAFRADMRETSGLKEEDLRRLAKEISGDPEYFPGYINSIVESESAITDVS
jgi:hypothetical protein